jgi:hypothetical protein
MRLPKRLVDLPAIKRFGLDDELVLVRPASEHVIVSVCRDEIDADDWDDGSGHLASLAPLRIELLAGDLRLFSLIWLLQLEGDELSDDCVEPPPGLTQVSGALAALAEFLAINPDLIAAATASPAPDVCADPSPKLIEERIRALPETEKVALLLRLYSGDDPHLGTELRRRLRKADAQTMTVAPRRTAGELRTAAREIADARARAAEERARRELLRRQQQVARERKLRIAALAQRGEAAWREVEDLIGLRNGPAYDRAATLLVDLGVLADDSGEHESFVHRLAELHRRHERKGQLIARLEKAGLVQSRSPDSQLPGFGTAG